MIDRSITEAEFGRDYLGGRSPKTARRIIQRDGIPFFKVNGHVLIKLSDADAWREARMQKPAAPNLKSMLKQIADQALRDRRPA